jgi:hypothetical protein
MPTTGQLFLDVSIVVILFLVSAGVASLKFLLPELCRRSGHVVKNELGAGFALRSCVPKVVLDPDRDCFVYQVSLIRSVCSRCGASLSSWAVTGAIPADHVEFSVSRMRKLKKYGILPGELH